MEGVDSADLRLLGLIGESGSDERDCEYDGEERSRDAFELAAAFEVEESLLG